MRVFDVFALRGDNYTSRSISRTYDIIDTFYEKLQYLHEHIYDASINQMVNMSILNLINTENIQIYKTDGKEFTSRHGFYIKASLVEGLKKLEAKYPSLSIGKLINIAIYVALAEQEDHLQGYYEMKKADPGI